MNNQKQTRDPICRILLDGGSVSRNDLESSLNEQKHLNELLADVLVRMGVLDRRGIRAVLSIQPYPDRPEVACRIAADERQTLGDLLIQAGHITEEQLEQAITEQKRSGKDIGEVFVRLGLLTERQLHGMLNVYRAQNAEGPSFSPLSLGEILITTGVISHEQLKDALSKQALTGKRLSDVLIEDGYAEPHHIRHGLYLQQILMTSMLVSILTVCGGGGNAILAPDSYTVASSSNSPAESGSAAALTIKSGEALNAVAFGNSIFVAVGDLGKVLTSADLTTWEVRISGTDTSLLGVAFGNDRFAAVGADGIAITSSDGIVWNAVNSGSSAFLYSVAYGNGVFAAVGNNGTIVTSTDGASWRASSSCSTRVLYCIAFCNGRFITVGERGTILTSRDGIHWSAAGYPTEHWLFSVTFAKGVYVAVGSNGFLLTSADAVNWTAGNYDSALTMMTVAFDGVDFVAAGEEGPLLKSRDGVNWIASDAVSSGRLYGLARGSDKIVAVGY